MEAHINTGIREEVTTTQVDLHLDTSAVSYRNPNQEENRTFPQVVVDELQGAVPLRLRSTPKLIGGNVAVTIDEDVYVKGLSDFNRSLIARLVLTKGDKLITILDLKTKLSLIWQISEASWMLTPLGRCSF